MSAIEDPGLKRWARFCRRQVRDYVRETKTMPPLAAWVSDRANPRRSLLVYGEGEDSLDVKAAIQGALHEHHSEYAAVGARLRLVDDHDERGSHFGLVVVAPFETIRYGALIERKGGREVLAGWEDGTFQLGDDFAFVAQTLRAAQGRRRREMEDVDERLRRAAERAREAGETG